MSEKITAVQTGINYSIDFRRPLEKSTRLEIKRVLSSVFTPLKEIRFGDSPIFDLQDTSVETTSDLIKIAQIPHHPNFGKTPPFPVYVCSPAGIKPSVYFREEGVYTGTVIGTTIFTSPVFETNRKINLLRTSQIRLEYSGMEGVLLTDMNQDRYLPTIDSDKQGNIQGNPLLWERNPQGPLEYAIVLIGLKGILNGGYASYSGVMIHSA